MHPALQFDFTVDKENNRIYVSREFNASLPLLWDAWTLPEILDLWWAPKPYQNKTKSMDFREGGSWLYCMISPQNEIHWCKADYQKIVKHQSYSALDAFCDENGNINLDFPRCLWSNRFSESNDRSSVHITLQYQQLADLEKIIELGFREGFSMAMDNLDHYFLTSSKQQ